MATPNYEIKDKYTVAEVKADETAALNEIDVQYGNMISQSDQYFQKQIDAAQQYAETQKKNQQAQTDFAIEQINQQKAQAKQDYTKEQSGAYVDWQKQSNQYGVNAEQMAAQGMQNTGFSESSQVSMYNTYQNRVATAREAYVRAVQNYDNAITEARLQNNSALAEIAYQALQTQLELSLEGFQYKNDLIIQQSNKKMEAKEMYHNFYQDVLDQINQENALAEEVRQYNDKMAEEKRQYNETLAIQKAQLAEEKRQFNLQYSASQAKSSGGGSSIKKSSSGSKRSANGTSKNTGKANIKATNISDVEKGSSGKSSSKNTIDMGSVLALGYGPISASRLNELVKSGVVEQYKSGGKTKFRKSAYTNKQSKLFGF